MYLINSLKCDMKIVLGDFNAKAGREDIFNETSHKIT
jgi:hypothetical protein